MQSIALVLELVDKRDLKSLAPKGAYGFDPRPEHKGRLVHFRYRLYFHHSGLPCGNGGSEFRSESCESGPVGTGRESRRLSAVAALPDALDNRDLA